MPITEAQSRELIEAAIAQAKRMDRRITVAVVDASGYLTGMIRMDGAGFLTPQIAEAKAFSAAAWGLPTSVIAERAQARPATYQAYMNLGRTQLVPGQGGLPVRDGSGVIAAVGVSGASGDEDDLIAKTAVEALAPKA